MRKPSSLDSSSIRSSPRTPLPSRMNLGGDARPALFSPSWSTTQHRFPQNLIEKPRGTLTAEETGDVPVSVQSRSKKLTTQQNCFLLARTVAVVVVGCRRKEESVGSGSGSERLPGMGMRMMGWSRGGAHVSSYTFRPC